MKGLLVVALVLLFVPGVLAQEPIGGAWIWNASVDARVNYRDSNHDRFALKFPFAPEMLPPGAENGWMETVDAGSRLEASLLSFVFDVEYGSIFAARAKVDTIDLYDRNPTGSDEKIDLDEIWIRVGSRP